MASLNRSAMTSINMQVIHPKGVDFFRNAMRAEEEKRYIEAARLYTEGVEELFKQARGSANPVRAEAFTRVGTGPFVRRAEAMKRKAEIADYFSAGHGSPMKIVILEDEDQRGLATIFDDYIDGILTEVEVDDLSLNMEVFINFCGTLILKADNLETIIVKTKPEHGGPEIFDDIRVALLEHEITLVVESGELDHSEVRLDNGWVFKMPLGLDYFKHMEKGDDSDLDFRPCKPVTIEVYQKDPSSDTSSSSLGSVTS